MIPVEKAKLHQGVLPRPRSRNHRMFLAFSTQKRTTTTRLLDALFSTGAADALHTKCHSTHLVSATAMDATWASKPWGGQPILFDSTASLHTTIVFIDTLEIPANKRSLCKRSPRVGAQVACRLQALGAGSETSHLPQAEYRR